MKALILSRHSKNPLDAMSVTDCPTPVPRPGEVLLRMRSAALNPADLHIATGEMKMMSPVKPPFVLGVDGVGVVESDGRRFKKGDRVVVYTGLVHCGTLAEFMAVPEDWLAQAPETYSDHEAAALPLSLLVAVKALARSGAKPGERILVHGAGGPVGAAIVALAARRGLIVTGSGSGADEAHVRGLGASSYVDYRTGSVASLGQRYDIAVDSLGGAVFDESLRLLRPGGRLVSLKVMTGTDDMTAMGMAIPFFMRLLLPLVFFKPRRAARRAGVQLIGLASHQDGAALAEGLALALEAEYRPRIDQVFPLGDVKAAFKRLSSGPRGKVVVSIDG